MAGIGFRLAHMARTGGIGGAAAAAVHGATISSGPWLLAAGTIMALEQWSRGHAGADAAGALQTILIYAFSVSALIAGPIVAVTTRALSDLLYARRSGDAPGMLAASLMTVTLVALPAGAVIYALAGLAPVDQLLSVAILALLAQIWVANLFLTAIHAHRAILTGYAVGAAAAALAAWPIDAAGLRGLLMLTITGLLVTDLCLIRAIRVSFAGIPSWPADWRGLFRRHAHIAAGGIAAAVAIWIDKWMLWGLSADSVASLGMLRHHPIYDPASFLGLLALVPGLTLLLVVMETRFDRQFMAVMAACAGAGTIGGIDGERRRLARVVVENLRLLIVAQGTIAVLLWVLAPAIAHAIGMDPRGIFAFRFTVVGTVFHLIALFATIILSYCDLFGRVLVVWTLFAVFSAIGTLAHLSAGFAGLGWGYMAGAAIAAVAGLTLVAQAIGDLTYLLFVGNNPSIMGERRRWA